MIGAMILSMHSEFALNPGLDTVHADVDAIGATLEAWVLRKPFVQVPISSSAVE
jgi:hypothetical protein